MLRQLGAGLLGLMAASCPLALSAQEASQRISPKVMVITMFAVRLSPGSTGALHAESGSSWPVEGLSRGLVHGCRSVPDDHQHGLCQRGRPRSRR